MIEIEKKLRYFKLSEFDSRLEEGSGVNMKDSTLLKLDEAREQYGRKVRITSGFRVDADYERLKRQGYEVVRNSSHFLGYAADLSDWDGLSNSAARWRSLLNALWDAGFRRFGIMRNAIHVDDDPSKSSPAIWKYGNTHSTIWTMAKIWFEEKRRSRRVPTRK